MFFHLFKYKIVQLFHTKEIILWMFLFPVLLGTFFYMGFGNLLEGDEDFEPIPVAVVEMVEDNPVDPEQISNRILKNVIKELSKETEDQFFVSTWTEEEKAKKLLEKGSVDGIIYVSEKPKLMVKENGINQSILDGFLSQYLSQAYAVEDIIRENPQKMQDVVRELGKQTNYNQEISENSSGNSMMIQYFYALIAMVCLYGCIPGQMASISIQPHLSAVGARKNIAPVHKLQVILADFTACVLVNYLSVLLVFLYLILVLNIDMGSRIPQELLASLVGSVIGVSMGMFTGAIGNWDEKTKEGVSMAVSMLCCFLGGLMINDMPNIIEQHVPIINRINPAALLSDSFYSLDVYRGYERFEENLAAMLIIAAVLCLGSYGILRRKTAK